MPVAAAAGAEEEEEEEEVTMNPGAAAAAAEVANMMRCDREHAHELISMKSLKLRIGRRLKILLIYSSSLYFCFVLLLCSSAVFFCFVLLLFSYKKWQSVSSCITEQKNRPPRPPRHFLKPQTPLN
jgi:hypothetical protein